MLFADRTFPDTARYLQTAAPALQIEVDDLAAHPQRRWTAPVVVPLMTRIDGAVMDRIDGLKLIQQWGAGLEGVDLAAATARGIAVGNVASTATGNAESVAEWCIMAALALSRHLPDLSARMRHGGAWGGPVGRSLLGRTACIVGLGGIGQALASRLRPFGMQIVAATRTPDTARAAAFGIADIRGLDRLGSLLGISDYVFLCLPLTRETRHIIDAATLQAMRPEAFLINAGRGGLVDQDALLQAINARQIAGAGLDVFTPEPLSPSSPLLERAEILATPHIAGVTDWSYARVAQQIAQVIEAVAAKAPLPHCINWPAVAERIYAA
ncbi:2-hydroxyacid dehydrogenase [Roseomonas sp. E05]|uniref:2-hydroxyacid dehydrogenase n=1 Tax=Roseomonas sp. E05 TaxID=3046310 RepID=UPI0024BA66CB|nr:2-hydroxyacid dehydrogenase [Roseomonas sp. E05]MDJ0391683.1 2-hydroxyacid dehydrogenase [Roseomonas sp. E05]